MNALSNWPVSNWLEYFQMIIQIWGEKSKLSQLKQNQPNEFLVNLNFISKHVL